MAAAPLFLAGALYEGAAAVGVLYVIVLALYTALDALLLPRPPADRGGPKRARALSVGVSDGRALHRGKSRPPPPFRSKWPKDCPSEIDTPARAWRRLAAGQSAVWSTA